MKKIIIQICALLCLFQMRNASALLVGSDLAVSVESFASFPEVYGANPNEIASFAWMKNGFNLENSATELLFRSIYPVSGTVDFAGGTVTLGTDLIFQNVTTLNGLGVIVGGGHTLHISSSISSLPDDTHTFDNTHLSFEGNVLIDTEICFTGDCILSGSNNLIMLGGNGGLVVAPASTLHIKNINFMGVNSEKIRCADNDSMLILENVRWIQDGFFTFTTGAISFEDQVEFSGTGTFFYESSMTSTIEMDSHWKLSEDLVLKMGRYPETLSDPIHFIDGTSFLTLDNVDFIASDSGIELTNGSIIFDRSVTIDSVNTGTDRGMIVGNGIAANDLSIRLSPGCSVIHNSGYWVYNNGDSDRFKSSSHTASLIRNEGSKIAVHTDLAFPKQSVEIVSALVSPVEVAVGKTLSYVDTRIVLPTIEFELTGNQLSAFVYQLDGNDEMFFTKGTMPLAILTTNAGNVIKGNGGINGPLILSSSAAELSLDILGELRSSVTLNNGTFSLLSPLFMNAGAIFNGPGVINLSTYALCLSPQVTTWQSSIRWNDSGTLQLQSELDLSDTWTISGELILDGKGNILRLVDNGKLFLETDAHLIMKNIIIQGVGGENISCTDDSCRLSFFGARWLLDDDFTVTHGAIDFEKSNSIGGPYTMTFDQILTNTIKLNSGVTFDCRITSSFGRTSQGVEPIYFEDDTAHLCFDDATLGIKSSGLTLSRGTVAINKQCVFDFNSTSTANGLQLGNGVASDDITINLNPGASIQLGSGHILQNITDIEKGFVGLSTSSKLIIETGLVTHYKQDGKLGNMGIDITPPTTVSFDSGINVYLEKALVDIQTAVVLITARRFLPLVLALEGAPDSVEILSGTFPQPLVISGTGNVLKGSGVVTGFITYLSPTAELEWANLGTLNTLITLNGGTLTLGTDLMIVGSGGVVGPGTIDLNGQTALYGINDIMQSVPMTFMGDGSIKFNSTVDLAASVLFQDYTTIEGANNILTFSTGELVVDSGATLVLKDIVLDKISANAIRCVDDTGVVIFNNAQIILSDTFTFTHGAMQFLNKNVMQGDHSFVYETQMTSTILADSALKLDSGVTFSYDPPHIEGNNRLIQFENTSSQFILNGASFITTSSGIELTKGCLNVKQTSSLSSTSDPFSGLEPGISFGDGVNDLSVIVRPGVRLILERGLLAYRNSSSLALNLISNDSAISIESGATLQLFKNLTTGTGKTILKSGARLLHTNDSNVIGTIEPQGVVKRSRFTP